jgi:predicted phage terminase large subunit-like protein
LSLLRSKRAQLKRLTAAEFRQRYPTPGALAQAYLPSTRQTPALDAIDAALVTLADAPEDRGRQMVFMAPQEGKSSRVSNWFPLWMLAQDPTLRIAIVSYAANKAERWGRWLRRMIEAHPELGVELAADSRAVDAYETTVGGRVVSVGISGGIAGEPVDLMIIDDPIRGRAEAESPTYRENAWDWWESNGATRLSARGRVVLMLTRWHCLLPDSDILTDMGIVRLDSITSEDRVSTSAGLQPVLATASKIHQGDVISLVTYGYPKPVRMTPEHRVLTDAGWREAGKLRPMDWLVFPIPQGDTDPQSLRALVPPPPPSRAASLSRLTGVQLPVDRDGLAADLAAGLSYQAISEKYGRTTRAAAFGWARHYGLTRSAHNVLTGDPTTDPDFWRVVGYWAAEGDLTSGRAGAPESVVRWTFGYTEEHLAKDVQEVMGRYGIKIQYRYLKNGRSISVRGSSTQMAEFLRTNFGSGSHGKRLSEPVVHLSPLLAKAFILGYWMGDGTATPVGGSMNDGWARITSVSLSLLMGVYRMLPRLGVAAQVMSSGGVDFPKFEIRFPVCGAPWLGVTGRAIKTHSARVVGGNLLVKIKAIRVDEYDGPVYDIQTSTGDFVAGNITVHNCDDLAGRLLKEEPDTWKVLRIPAVRDPNIPLVRGADGRSVYTPQGELISVQRRRPGYYLDLKTKRSMYVWNSIYMQTPVAAEGNLFHRADFRYWVGMGKDRSHHDPTGGMMIEVDGVRRYVGDMTRFITMDLAASVKTSADWTVAAVWGITLDGQLILLDRRRERIGESAHWQLLAPLCGKWACPDVYVERGFIGTTLVIDATKAGIRVQPLTPEADKITRAIPATNRVRAHTVFFPAEAEWLDEWCDEIAGFPSWAHDDQADVFSYAGRIASAHWTPPAKDPDRFRALEQMVKSDPDRAFEAATGLPTSVDFSRADW